MSLRPARPASAPRRPGSGRTPILAAVGLGIFVVAFLAIVVGARLLTHPGRLNEATLCPAGGPSAITAILIDTTDPLNPIQRAAVAVRLNRIVSRLRLGEEIAVYSVNSTGDPLKPDFVICRPIKPAEVSELTGNRAIAQRRFDDLFAPRLRSVLTSATAGPPSGRSPIMAAIQAIAVSAFQGADAVSPSGRPLPKRLVIVSDMLENSEAGNHYKGAPDFAAYKSTPAYARVRSHLDGVTATILYLRRDDAAGVQGLSHIRFWNEWFADQGASVDDVVAIEG
ncbi:MAG: hypothetical protein M3T55_13325 [Pseudomonadota bacterium]|nr:hypothetical protein [Pseudomonadota bacterium]